MAVCVKAGKNRSLLIYFSFRQEWENEIGKVRGALYNLSEKCWEVPCSIESIKQLCRIFIIEDIIAAPEVSMILIDMNIDVCELKRKIALEVLEDRLKLKGYSCETQKIYIGNIKRYLGFFHDRSIEELDGRHIQQYLLYLLNDRNFSCAYIDQIASIIKFLHTEVLENANIELDSLHIKRQRIFTNTLSREETANIIKSANNPEHRMILMLIYFACLKAGEVVRMKCEDIDCCNHGYIRIKQGKGKKDWYILLPEFVSEQLQNYLKAYNKDEWLFEGKVPGKHINERTVQKILEDARLLAGIRRAVSVNDFRQTSISHRLERGADLRCMQELLMKTI